MNLKNASYLNEDIAKYINDIIQRVHSIDAENIDFLGVESQKDSDGWGSTKLSDTANINGVNVGLTRLLAGYVRNQKQRNRHVRKRIPISTAKTIGIGYDIAATRIVEISVDYIGVHSFDVPRGYSGNNSFVKVGIGYYDWDLLGKSSTIPLNYQSVKNVLDSHSDLKDLDNALLRFAPLVGDGVLGFEIAKVEKSITIKFNTTGVDWLNLYKDSALLIDPFIVIDAFFFKRGNI